MWGCRHTNGWVSDVSGTRVVDAGSDPGSWGRVVSEAAARFWRRHNGIGRINGGCFIMREGYCGGGATARPLPEPSLASIINPWRCQMPQRRSSDVKSWRGQRVGRFLRSTMLKLLPWSSEWELLNTRHSRQIQEGEVFETCGLPLKSKSS